MSTYPVEGIVVPELNAPPTDVITAVKDANAAEGVAIDSNAIPRDDRGPADNTAADAAIAAFVPNPDGAWIGERLGADAIGLPQSAYYSPPLDLTDPDGIVPNYAGEPPDLPLEPTA